MPNMEGVYIEISSEGEVNISKHFRMFQAKCLLRALTPVPSCVQKNKLSRKWPRGGLYGFLPDSLRTSRGPFRKGGVFACLFSFFTLEACALQSWHFKSTLG